MDSHMEIFRLFGTPFTPLFFLWIYVYLFLKEDKEYHSSTFL